MTNDIYDALASSLYISKQTLIGKKITTDDQKIRASGLYEDWVEGKYSVKDVRNANGQTWECHQAIDSKKNPGVTPNDPSWFTFWRPLHGKSPETARPFVQPMYGTTDIYHKGEYMIYTDGNMYTCISDTNFSPTDFEGAWKKV